MKNLSLCDLERLEPNINLKMSLYFFVQCHYCNQEIFCESYLTHVKNLSEGGVKIHLSDPFPSCDADYVQFFRLMMLNVGHVKPM